LALTIAQLNERLSISPFHQWLGLRITAADSHELTLEMPWRHEVVSNPLLSSAHGGILAALIDLTGLYAILAAGGVARATINMQVDFHRPATPGRLRSIGRPIKLGRQLSVAETRVLDDEGKLLSSGRGTYIG
jgi:uncharacterized protein (TIGR00369 family)